MEGIQAFEWWAAGIIAAAFPGPIMAVPAGRRVDAARAQRERRWEVFRQLLRSRSPHSYLDFINALNLLELEFHNDLEVRNALRVFMQQANAPVPANPAEAKNWERELLDRRTRLLNSIARALDVDIHQHEMLADSHFLASWATAERENALVRRFALETLAGNRPLRVTVMPQGQAATGPQGQKTAGGRTSTAPAGSEQALRPELRQVREDLAQGMGSDQLRNNLARLVAQLERQLGGKPVDDRPVPLEEARHDRNGARPAPAPSTQTPAAPAEPEQTAPSPSDEAKPDAASTPSGSPSLQVASAADPASSEAPLPMALRLRAISPTDAS